MQNTDTSASSNTAPRFMPHGHKILGRHAIQFQLQDGASLYLTDITHNRRAFIVIEHAPKGQRTGTDVQIFETSESVLAMGDFLLWHEPELHSDVYQAVCGMANDHLKK